jgi:hypothetical protein
LGHCPANTKFFVSINPTIACTKIARFQVSTGFFSPLNQFAILVKFEISGFEVTHAFVIRRHETSVRASKGGMVTVKS